MKRLKDPIYGYIELDDEVCSNYVDTPEFQRLRRIVQTSYAPLYPSALHNRFVHSLGVYHLGLHVAKSLDRSVKKLFSDDDKVLGHWKKAVGTYKLACLLHDFAHSPFSHAGEIFYRPYGYDSLDDELAALVGDPDFSEDVNEFKGSRSAAPHELMSAILALEKFGHDIPLSALFARCITGYQHQSCVEAEDYLDNILIQMLNSNTIDVDRLDYLIRDSYVVGFDSIAIDYVRLLDGLRIIRKGSGYQLAYYKTSISVLENVIYARDYEKKWIQSHPAVLYDQYLVQYAIRTVNDKFKSPDGKKLLCKDALTNSGVTDEDGRLVRLASDDDIVFLAKNCYRDSLIDEYFDRAHRSHPVWKSEAEYRANFSLNRQELEAAKEMESIMAELEKSLRNIEREPILDASAIEFLEEELRATQGVSRQEKKRRQSLERQLDLLEGLKDFSTEHNLEFSYVLIRATSFKSGFRDGSLGDLRIVFSEEESGASFLFKDVAESLVAADNPELAPFYIYHKSANLEKFPRKEFVQFLKACFEL